MNENVYIHEFIDIIGHARAKYMHHMTANWSPIAQEERDQRCFGVWGTVGTTGRWPEVVNMWEESGFAGLAAGLGHETGRPSLQDEKLEKWWAEAAGFRRGGVDRLLVPAPWSPTIGELNEAGVSGAVYAHEMLTMERGTARNFLELVGDHAVPALAEHDITLVGAFRTALRDDDECVVMWAIPTWDAWAAYETAIEAGELSPWIERRRANALTYERFLMSDAPLSPLKIGRQPARSDREDGWTDL
jgi:hypothetical protein